MVQKKRLWIDTDLNPPPASGSRGTFVGANVDDAVALLSAMAHPSVELVGVSTVGSDAERRAAVAVGLLAGAGADLGMVPVVAGAETPGGDVSAVVEAVGASGAEALLAIGPLTNVAALTVAGARPPELTLMGGALRPVEHRGETRTVEHNFGSDPEAAAVVLAEPGAVIVPLDATVAARLDDRLVGRLVATAPVLEPMVQAWLAEWGEVVLHDPAALLVAAGDGTELGKFERRRLRVDPDGRLIDGGQGAAGTVHDVVTSLFGSAVVASVLALLADLKVAGS
ncbi:MAG TPA: nucleoside hydrolase [Acidimicrobiia bacterium]|nr:nucleoside hydrolase [Acidimicrobiia bacterium]